MQKHSICFDKKEVNDDERGHLLSSPVELCGDHQTGASEKRRGERGGRVERGRREEEGKREEEG